MNYVEPALLRLPPPIVDTRDKQIFLLRAALAQADRLIKLLDAASEHQAKELRRTRDALDAALAENAELRAQVKAALIPPAVETTSAVSLSLARAICLPTTPDAYGR